MNKITQMLFQLFSLFFNDNIKVKGVYQFECFDKYGNLKWKTDKVNTVVTVGKNQLLNDGIDNSTGYMGLISSVDWSAVAAGDTMSSHSGWKEAGNTNAPTYTAPRKTCVWAAAGSGAKALSAALTFAITGTGTLKGAFIVFGTGASSTIENTSGVLLSAGTFSEGDRSVVNGDTVNISYTITLT